MASTQMKAWQITAPGPKLEDILKLSDVSRPSEALKAQDVLIKVVSASINPADYKVPQTGAVSKLMVKFPNTVGMDLSGTVAAIGSDVAGVVVGDAVMARLDPRQSQGGLSEYVVVSKDDYAKVSPQLDFDISAGAPTTALTAYQSISPYVTTGDKIFINGGSGGAGTFGIQIGKALGLHVTVSCSTAKKELCQRLGADEIIDYKVTDVAEHLKKNGQVYKLVVDNVGSSPPNLYQLSRYCLLPEGVFVQVGSEPSLGSIASVARSLLLPSFLGGGKNKYVMYLTKNSSADLGQIAQWLNEGAIKTIVDSTFEFEDVQKAYTYLKKGSSEGKIVVHVSKPN